MKKKVSHIRSPDDDDDEDGLLSTLSLVATSNPQSAPPIGKFKSRFFFTLRPGITLEKERRQKEMAPKKLRHVDEEIVNRSATYKKELPPALEKNIATVREFFLKELSPLTLAAVTGSDQAVSVVQSTLGSEVDPRVMLSFERMMNKSVNMRMARFLTRYFGLDKAATEELLASVAPAKREAIFINTPPQPGPQEGREKWTPAGEE